MRMTQESQESSSLSSTSSSPSSSSSSSTLGEAIDVVSSLISLSHLIKVFAGKWAFIRSKLEELNSDLIAVESCDSTENPILSGLVSAIIATAKECHELAEKCLNLSYKGKLLMKSELNVIASKFDRHVKNLSGISTSGVLSHGSAIVVSRPAANACKDDLRFYLRDLLIRMKIGDTDMKRQALFSLHDVLEEDGRYANIAFETADVANVVTSILDSDEPELQEEAAKIVCLVSGFGMHKSVLVGAGVVGSLVLVVERSNKQGKEAAVRSLVNLTENSDNAWLVSAHGGVTAILRLCSDNEPSSSLISPACCVLRNLLSVEEIKKFMVEEGAISTFVNLMNCREERIQVISMEFLQSIASGDQQIRKMIVDGGGIRAMMRFLDPWKNSTAKSKEIALKAVESFFPACVNEMIDHGFVTSLLPLLKNSDVCVQEAALKLAVILAGASDDVRKTMGEGGFMAEFAIFLEAKSFSVREAAAEGLCSLISLPKNRKMLIYDDKSIGFVFRLLDHDEGPENKKLLIQVLMALTACNGGRKKIASSGYLQHIENLAEAEVSDAKRLVKKLRKSSLRRKVESLIHYRF